MKKILFAAMAALAALVLWTACDGEGEETPSTWTVTFHKNNEDIDAAEMVTVKVPDGGTVGDKMPDSPGAEYGPLETSDWTAGYKVLYWHESPNGPGGGKKELLRKTIIDRNWDVYAIWTMGQSQYVNEAGELAVIAPAITSSTSMHGTFDGTSNEDGSITWSNGGIRWQFPDEAVPANYDFVKIEYIGKGKDGSTTGSITGNILKQFNTSTDYMPRTGTQYPSFALPTGSIEFVVRDGTGGGMAIQVNTGSGGGERTMKFTKATFSQGTRFPITFNLGFDNAPAVSDGFGVQGLTVGSLLLNEKYPQQNKPGSMFDGWKSGNTLVTASTPVTGRLDLIAQWKPAVAVSEIKVNFSDANTKLAATGGTATAQDFDGDSGYVFVYGSGNYNGAFARFTVTLPAGANLAAFKQVTFDGQAVQGDTSNKPFALLAKSPSLGSLPNDPHGAGTDIRINSNTISNAGISAEWKTVTFDIDKAKASSLSGSIEFCIYDHSGNGSSAGAATTWNIKKVIFIPEE